MMYVLWPRTRGVCVLISDIIWFSQSQIVVASKDDLVRTGSEMADANLITELNPETQVRQSDNRELVAPHARHT